MNTSRSQLGLSFVAGAIALVALALSGCGISALAPSSTVPGALLQGRVRGGQQPVSGASIALYAAGSAGDGLGATNLLAPNIVTTDANGDFGITGDYLCPTSTTQVYLVASGGNPGLAPGTDNSALVLMAALGNCGNLTSSTNIMLDEVTTVASAWALAQFLGPGAIVGSTSTNSIGLSNAFAVANNLVDTGTGLAPGALPAGAVTESAKLNALANTLASCVNSPGGVAGDGSGCGNLFSLAPSGAGADNTLDAALNVVRNPENNVAAVFNAGTANAPFLPALSGPPNDWTMSITYGGCTPACGGLNTPESLAIDSAGNIWVANYFGGAVSEFFPSGVPVSATGFPGTGLGDSTGIAIDTSGNAWVTNNQTHDHSHGSVSEFSPSGVELSGNGYTGGGIYYPVAVAADSTGAIWIANYEGKSASLLDDSNGSAISGSSGYGYNVLPFINAVAVDANHNAWFAVQTGAALITPSGAVSSFFPLPCLSGSSCHDPEGIAIDPSGNVWLADKRSSEVIELTPAGNIANQTTINNGNDEPQGIAVDGAGNVWAADSFGDSVVELSGSTAAVISPPAGYGLDAPIDQPYGIAIDASGNLWLSNSGSARGNTITRLVGLASPVKTPLLGPPVQP
jgi:streptogramin lyase